MDPTNPDNITETTVPPGGLDIRVKSTKYCDHSTKTKLETHFEFLRENSKEYNILCYYLTPIKTKNNENLATYIYDYTTKNIILYPLKLNGIADKLIDSQISIF